MYLILNGSDFDRPYHPGYLSVIIYVDTGSIISELMRQHKVNKMQFGITKAFDDSLKQQILAAFHNDYVEVVSNENAVFA